MRLRCDVRPNDADLARFELRKDVLIAEFRSSDGLWQGLSFAIAGATGVTTGAFVASSISPGTLAAVLLAEGALACAALRRLERYRKGFRREATKLMRDLGRFKDG